MIRTWSLRSVFLGLMAIVTSGSLSYAADEKGWINLFNGKDLTGWIQKGGMAKYRIENDEIVGSSVPNTANSFLCTTKDYGNFILEVEFKVHPELNSGVQIRSQVFEEAKTADIKGKTFKFASWPEVPWKTKVVKRKDRILDIPKDATCKWKATRDVTCFQKHPDL